MEPAPRRSCREMAIVDTFTKLIFGEEGGYSQLEQEVIQALRLEDASLALASPPDLGGYLRALGVAEMIALVDRVEQQLHRPERALSAAAPRPVRGSARRV